VPIEEISRNGSEDVRLATLLRGPLAVRLDLWVNAPGIRSSHSRAFLRASASVSAPLRISPPGAASPFFGM
jgi:hypothetical protein